MRRIFSAINRIIKKHTDVKVVYPVHPNPPVVRAAAEAFSGNPRVRLVEPMDVVDFHNVLARSHIVLTDSGGIQEEAPSLGKPVIVLRDTTERPEGIAAGTLKLAGTQEATVFGIIDEILTDQAEYEKMSRAKNPYGDGMASVRIANAIAERFPREKGPRLNHERHSGSRVSDACDGLGPIIY
jgi:UDP-N-acetylglucosamine 2-epimerase (non-hydrolysing)